MLQVAARGDGPGRGEAPDGEASGLWVQNNSSEEATVADDGRLQRTRIGARRIRWCFAATAWGYAGCSHAGDEHCCPPLGRVAGRTAHR